VKLFDAPRCPYCARVRITLAEKGISYEAVEIDERYPAPPLQPADPVGRARTRLLVHRFDENLGDDYYAFRRGEENALAQKLHALEVGHSLFADIAYAPWVIRARDMLGVDLPERLESWLAELTRRPSVAAEVDLVGTL